MVFFIWLPVTVSKNNEPPRKRSIILTSEEKSRLVAYFNVLIDMDREIDKDATNETQENRVS